MTDADVVICCTGATGHMITADVVPAGRRETLVFLDVAMPHDVEPAVADLPGVVVIGLDALREHRSTAAADDVAAVRAIVEAELAAYHSARRTTRSAGPPAR
jgi:glutamyl-tRNA reductase